MMRTALVVAFAAVLAASCLAQQTSWKAEPQDGLLIAPGAAGVQYTTTNSWDRLTYTVQESYPTTRLWKSLCHQLEQKDWHALLGCSDTDQWWHTPYTSRGISRTSYRRQISFAKEDREIVDYFFDYDASDGENYLQKLHVEVAYRVGKPVLTSPQITTVPAKPTPQMSTSPSKIDFGAVRLESTSAPQVLTYTFRSQAEIQRIDVDTDGEQRLDFKDAGTGSCRTNRVYKAGDSCTVNVTFAPRLAAERRGFVMVMEPSGANVITDLVGTGTGESGQSAGPTPSARRIIEANDRVTAVMPDRPAQLGQPYPILLKLTDSHVIGIGEIQTQGDRNSYTNISSGSAVGTGEAKIIADTGPSKTMQVIPLGVGKLKLGIMVSFTDGGIAQKEYTLDVTPASTGLKYFFLNQGGHALAIVLKDKPQDSQTWLSPQVAYQQLEYPIYLEDSSQVSFTVLQSSTQPVIHLDPNGLVHGLRPGKATIIGDFAGVKDQVIVTVYTKQTAPASYQRIAP